MSRAGEGFDLYIAKTVEEAVEDGSGEEQTSGLNTCKSRSTTGEGVCIFSWPVRAESSALRLQQSGRWALKGRQVAQE